VMVAVHPVQPPYSRNSFWVLRLHAKNPPLPEGEPMSIA
jgi:hypothetical protein